MHLLFEASLTQPNSANLLGKKSEQQRGTGPSYMWKSMARCPFEIRHEAKQRQTKWQAQTPKSCRLLFVFLRVALCFQDLFRSSHLRAVFLLRVASFFWFPAACVLLIFAPSTHTHLLVDFLSQSFCFLFAIMIVARMAAMVAWNACHLLSVIAHAVCCANSLPMPVATCSVCIEMCHWNRRWIALLRPL